jgi:hypothetical protein
MAYLDEYFSPEEEQGQTPPGGSAPSAPSGPVSGVGPGVGTATGAPDRPTATALPTAGGSPAQNGTGFVGIGQYFAPNAEVAGQQTADYLGGLDQSGAQAARGPGGLVGDLQKRGGPTYTAGMAGTDAYLMGRSGVEGGLSDLAAYFDPEPTPREETPSQTMPRKPIYDPDMDPRERRPGRWEP